MLRKLTRLGGLYTANGRRRHVGERESKISFLAARKPRRGAAKTILLIHGAGMSARSWALQIQGLSPSHQVLAMDLPGHGASDPIAEGSIESYTDAACSLLTMLGIGPVFVAGHSLGGSVALALAARRPELVKGLVLISSCAKTPQSGGTFKALLGSLPAPFGRMLFSSTARSFLFALGANKTAVQLALRDLRNCRPETIRKDMAAAEAMNLENAAQDLRIPTLILCGTSDIVTPLRLSEKLTGLIPGAQLHVVDGAGHMLPLEAPERVNQEISEFVASVDEDKVRQTGSVVGAAKRHITRLLADRVRRFCRG
ncbi:MAG TPA: alpha/beta hydrolase [Gemmatimonadaceae bacterium]